MTYLPFLVFFLQVLFANEAFFLPFFVFWSFSFRFYGAPEESKNVEGWTPLIWRLWSFFFFFFWGGGGQEGHFFDSLFWVKKMPTLGDHRFWFVFPFTNRFFLGSLF